MASMREKARDFVHDLARSGLGRDRDEVVRRMAAAGFTELEGSVAFRLIFGTSLLEGRDILRAHPSWRDVPRSTRTLEEWLVERDIEDEG